MTDDVKAAVEYLKATNFTVPSLLESAVATLLAHLDGEPGRLAAAREEQREACALDAEERVGCASTYDEIRSVPLTTTPLADEIRALRERAEKAEAEQNQMRLELKSIWKHVDGEPNRQDAALRQVCDERDALRAQVERVQKERDEMQCRLDGMMEQCWAWLEGK